VIRQGIHRVALPLLVTSLGLVLSTACEFSFADPTPTPPPTATSIPTPTAPADTPTPPPTPKPELVPGMSIVVGGGVRKRPEPSTFNEEIGGLPDGYPLNVVAVVQGENWLLGSQTWLSQTPSWASDWMQLDDGGYVYGAFVFTLLPDETSPLRDPGGLEKWIDVDISDQTVSAMIGDQAIHMALASTGSAAFPTPMGTHHIEPDGRVAVGDMTASQAGYAPGEAQYNVERVHFTQYFDRYGNAIHLNYWRPEEVFGATATSHGCVGLQLHDAQYFWLFGEPGMRVEIHD
jgi:hypothetical protein